MRHWSSQPVRQADCVCSNSWISRHTHAPVSTRPQGAVHLGLALLVIIPMIIGASATLGWAGDPATSPDLMDLNLNQLMDLEVTSVSKQPEKLADAAAAIFVITRDDIRRAGAQNLPDILRMVPGLQIGQINQHRWAVTARGFNGAFANKLLVLVDGRSVYTPTFSGVYWEVQNLPLQDIDRIEVIRGPGATLWGVNAVNGVINIITKPAEATQGLHLETGGGSGELEHFESVRYGGQLGESAWFRVYGKLQATGASGTLWHGVGVNNPAGVSQPLTSARDDVSMGKTGFRADAELSERDHLTVQGDAYDGTLGTSYILPEVDAPYSRLDFDVADVSGANVLTRLTHRFGRSQNQLQAQLYYDRAERSDILYGETSNAFDVDVQQLLKLSEWCNLLTGLEYRYVDLKLNETEYLNGGDSPHRPLRYYSGFAQADLSFWKNRVGVTVGAKLEDTEYSTGEVQPNLRMRMELAQNHAIWAAVSRAVRTPSGMESDGGLRLYTIPPFSLSNQTPMTIVAEVQGTASFGSESVTAFEAGYRALLTPSTSIDISAFRNEYGDLVVNQRGDFAINSPTVATQALIFENGMSATTSGLEVASDWQVLHEVRLRGAYTYLDMQLTVDEAMFESEDRLHPLAYGHVPQHQVSIRSQMNVQRNVECDLWVRAVDELSTLDIDGYTELDLRVQWRPMPSLAIAAVGRNLLHDEHREFFSELTGLDSGITRSGYIAVSMDF